MSLSDPFNTVHLVSILLWHSLIVGIYFCFLLIFISFIHVSRYARVKWVNKQWVVVPTYYIINIIPKYEI